MNGVEKMMKVKLRFLSVISDYTKIYEAELRLDKDVMKFSEVIDIVKEKYPGLKEVEEKIPIILLLDGKKVSSEYLVREGNEIAFLPPASGG